MRHVMPALLASAAIAVSPAPPAQANDLLIGAVVGGVVGYAIGSQQGKARAASGGGTRTSTSYRPAAERGDVNIQRALNHFGFNAGAEDGVFGPGTRAAIRRYQAHLGDEVSGQLTAAQRSLLLSEYARATTPVPAPAAGAAPAGGTAGGGAATGAGLGALLASLQAQQPGGAAPAVPAEQPLIARLCDTPAETVRAVSLEALPPDGAAKIVVQGYCTARSYALEEARTVIGQVPNFDPATAKSQCEDWMASQRPAIDAALARPAEDAAVALRGIVPGATDADRAALSASFALCHGLAQVAGDAATATGYAALLAVSGRPGYGEMVAGAQALGLGRAQDRARAAEWYAWTVAELDAGGVPLIASEGYDHAPLLLALAETAPGLTTDGAGFAARRGTVTPAGLPALPGLPAAARPDPALQAVLDSAFPQVFGMSAAEGLAACAADGAEVPVLGLATCRALAAAAGRADLARTFGDRIAAFR